MPKKKAQKKTRKQKTSLEAKLPKAAKMFELANACKEAEKQRLWATLIAAIKREASEGELFLDLVRGPADITLANWDHDWEEPLHAAGYAVEYTDRNVLVHWDPDQFEDDAPSQGESGDLRARHTAADQESDTGEPPSSLGQASLL